MNITTTAPATQVTASSTLPAARPLASPASPLTRRRLLQASLAAGLGMSAWRPVRAHSMGPVQPPLAMPALKLKLGDKGDRGEPVPLPQLLRGQVTAVQLMFTSCSAVCPIQGAMYAEVQQQLARDRAPVDWRLLSVSIDALVDGPAQLQAWLTRHGAQAARWRAAVPAVADVDLLFDLLQGRVNGVDRHTAQVFVFNRQGALAFRTVDLPSTHEVLSAFRVVAASG